MSLMITHAAKLTGADIAITMQVEKDIPYAQLDELTLELDLYRPEKTPQGPLLLWVHGGAWRAGHRSSMPLSALVQEGMVIASVSYRLTTHARFPANVHDIKAAIRFLRANQKRLRIQADEIVIAGASAGGHLAALVGMSNRHPELEGQVGEYLDASSDVQGIISFYGASNLNTILSQSTPHGLGVRIPALQLLLGGQPDQQEALAQLASPVFHVDQTDPPLLMIHGDQDPQMPISQSLELLGRYERMGRSVTMKVIHGGAHGGPQFYDRNSLAWVRQFLKIHFP